MLKESVKSIKIFITSYIGTYQNGLDITDQDFIYTKSNKAQKKEDESSENGEDDKTSEHIINSHKDLVYNYFEFISEIVGDFVSKRIKLDMVNAFVNDLDKHLCKQVFQTHFIEKKIDKIFLDEENLQEDRKDAEKKLDSVRKALKIMLDIKYFEI